MRISDWSSDVCSSDLQSAFLERSTITLARLSSGSGASRIRSAPDVCFRERRCGLDFYLGMRRGLHIRAWEFSVAASLRKRPRHGAGMVPARDWAQIEDLQLFFQRAACPTPFLDTHEPHFPRITYVTLQRPPLPTQN